MCHDAVHDELHLSAAMAPIVAAVWPIGFVVSVLGFGAVFDRVSCDPQALQQQDWYAVGLTGVALTDRLCAWIAELQRKSSSLCQCVRARHSPCSQSASGDEKKMSRRPDGRWLQRLFYSLSRPLVSDWCVRPLCLSWFSDPWLKIKQLQF